MKIVLAPDAFKGSLTAIEAANTMKKAIHDSFPDWKPETIPMADGGEGTLDALLNATGGKRISIRCRGPLGNCISTSYGIIEEKTAAIECAKIIGLTLVEKEKRNPDITTSFGIGEVIMDALARGCTRFIVGLGGSATNDGGLGMLQALGMHAYNQDGKKIGPYGRDLLNLSAVDVSKLDKRLENVSIHVACDVTNPLCGSQGASAVFGPQKGATKEQVLAYDKALEKYSDGIESEIGRDFREVPGAGAAGGLGFALLALGAKLTSGAKLIAEAARLKEVLKDADLVITGEGQSDEQTLYGKAPGYVAELATELNVPAVLLSGAVTGDRDLLREKFAGCFSIITKPLSLEEAMDNAENLLYEQTREVIYFLNESYKFTRGEET
jgi:glycerate kinase